jgi:acyl carrier protein
MTAEVYARLTSVFHDVFGDDEIALTPTLTAKDVDGWDSLTHVRLMLTVERAFSIRLSAAEIGRLNNVGDLAELISRKTSLAT